MQGVATCHGCRRLIYYGTETCIQFTQKDKVGQPDIDAFEVAMMREDRQKGFFVAFDYTQDALHEIDVLFRRSGKAIVALTVKDILKEQIAYKLA